ncbi:unnamed protein product [Boreogadus saida]
MEGVVDGGLFGEREVCVEQLGSVTMAMTEGRVVEGVYLRHPRARHVERSPADRDGMGTSRLEERAESIRQSGGLTAGERLPGEGVGDAQPRNSYVAHGDPSPDP